MTKEEVQYEQESRKETQNQPTDFAKRMARAIVRLFRHLDVDSKITNKLQQDILDESFYSKFYIRDNSKPLDAVSVIYQHYKEETNVSGEPDGQIQ